jgi:molybdopterin converting factor small subunit
LDRTYPLRGRSSYDWTGPVSRLQAEVHAQREEWTRRFEEQDAGVSEAFDEANNWALAASNRAAQSANKALVEIDQVRGRVDVLERDHCNASGCGGRSFTPPPRLCLAGLDCLSPSRQP